MSKAIDSHAKHILFQRIKELETEKAELLQFVEDVCYNDINANDLKITWVQKRSWSLLEKYKECKK